MYIVSVSSSWGGDDFERVLGFNLVNDWLTTQGVQFIEESTTNWSYPYRSCRVVLTADQFTKLSAVKAVSLDVKCEVKHGGFTGNVELLLAKTEELIAKVGRTEEFNGKVNVHMPGNLLLQFNETLLLENSCTDALQDAMDKGWRVIAACPQPDQRRPDYILGRFNPETSNCASARRYA